MIDIFVEDIGFNNVKVYFVQLGCKYECSANNVKMLCDNIMSLYKDFSLKKGDKLEYSYLPVTEYNRLYNSDSILLYEYKDAPSYTVKKLN